MLHDSASTIDILVASLSAATTSPLYLHDNSDNDGDGGDGCGDEHMIGLPSAEV